MPAALQAVDQLYDSDEEPTPKATVLGTMKRMFTGKREHRLAQHPALHSRRRQERWGCHQRPACQGISCPSVLF